MKHYLKKRAMYFVFAVILCISSCMGVFAEEPESGYTEEVPDDIENEGDDSTDPGVEEQDDEDPEDADPVNEGQDDEDPEDAIPASEEQNGDEDSGTDPVTEEQDDDDAEDTEELTKEQEAAEILSQIEELAGGYDITAETVNVESDLEASFQTDVYSNDGDHIIGGSEKYTADENTDNDTISIGSIAEGTDSIRAEHTIETTIILDSDIVTDGLTITVTDETGSIVEASEEDGTLVIEDDIAGNVSEILDTISVLAEELMSLEADTEIERIDQNTESINASSIEASVVIADLETVEGWTETDGDGNEVTVEKVNYQSGMTIYVSEDQIVIINVTTSDDCDKVIMTQFTINLDGTVISSSSQSDENSSVASQIVFNFGDYDGEIYIQSGFTGIIIAPNATVTVGSTSTGQVIAETFSNPGGEWHGSGVGTVSESSDTDDDTPDVDEGDTPDDNVPGDDGGDTPDDDTPDDDGGDTPDDDVPDDDGDDTPDDDTSDDGEEDTADDDVSDELDDEEDASEEEKAEDEEDDSDNEWEDEEEDEEESDDQNETKEDESGSSSDESSDTGTGSSVSISQDTDSSSESENITETETQTHEEHSGSGSEDTDESITKTAMRTHTEESRSGGYTGDDGFGVWPILLAAAAVLLAGLLIYMKKRRV